MVTVGITALVAVVLLTLTGHSRATGPAATIDAASTGGGIRVNIRR
ncbi:MULTISPECIES: hypothetical protein [Streptomyces]|nr:MULTISPECIES: hypothetical protein [Streptomyces]MBX9420941.1 hypothetical protein [Streptomyces lateritius]